MAIAASDIKWYFSQQGGEASSGSLGGAIGTTEITDDIDNNLFDDVSGDESAVGDTEYRCFYLKNSHGSLTLSGVKLWIQQETPGGDSVDIALGTSGKNGTEQTIADEDTAPSGTSFIHPTSKSAGLNLGDLDAGDYYPIWVKRNVPASTSAYTANSFILRVEGDTPA